MTDIAPPSERSAEAGAKRAHLIAPHGGEMPSLMADAKETAELKEKSQSWRSWALTPRQLCDLELILNGGFSPLSGFMNRRDYDAVCEKMRLADGTLWPLPITLDVTEEIAEGLGPGDWLALRDPEGVMLAAFEITDLWKLDREAHAQAVFGTLDRKHAGVAHLFERTNNIAIGGRLRGLELPTHYDFVDLRRTPREMRSEFERLGWSKIVAFQTRNPMHRAHFEITLRAARDLEASLLINPSVGMTKPGDVDHYTRVRCYQKLLRRYPKHTALLSLLPLAMRMGGPREALLHAIIRKNYGCTHFIVGRDHAGPGKDSNGEPFYGPYEAQELFRQHEEELGIKMVPFRMMGYVEELDAYVPADKIDEGQKMLTISGTELRERLAKGREIPDWFTFPEVAEELRRTYPPRARQGFTVFFTGLSGAGKSTLANALMIKLLEAGGRPVTLLDGDIVRTNLSSELGFSKEHRDINIRRIGFVANEITKNGGIAICAPIAPYERVRNEVKSMIAPHGGYILVHVATPLEVCEERDRKGLYAKARAGIIKEFTGISDPYEEPSDADLVIDTSDLSPEAAVQKILLHLESEGYIGPAQ
ncbi:MAG TPA: bifunctional sulfate adenylyltransferase/adenylylsulfate kinase [Thermoanaerobaculia bacterium]|nr:bifunctional sulfate adenylyltransferase/adenylylsulfate kinase [Thermoanaerobaculia bacterium]